MQNLVFLHLRSKQLNDKVTTLLAQQRSPSWRVPAPSVLRLHCASLSSGSQADAVLQLTTLSSASSLPSLGPFLCGALTSASFPGVILFSLKSGLSQNDLFQVPIPHFPLASRTTPQGWTCCKVWFFTSYCEFHFWPQIRVLFFSCVK